MLATEGSSECAKLSALFMATVAESRTVGSLPQSEILRVAGALFDIISAKSWADAKGILRRYPELSAKAVDFLPEVIKEAARQGEMKASLLLGDYQELLQRVLAQGVDNLDLREIPKLCCERWQDPCTQPLAFTVADIMLLARPL